MTIEFFFFSKAATIVKCNTVRKCGDGFYVSVYAAVTKQNKSHQTKEDRSRDEAPRRWQQQAPAHNIRGSRCRCSVKIALQSPPACPVLTRTLAGLNATLSDL